MWRMGKGVGWGGKDTFVGSYPQSSGIFIVIVIIVCVIQSVSRDRRRCSRAHALRELSDILIRACEDTIGFTLALFILLLATGSSAVRSRRQEGTGRSIPHQSSPPTSLVAQRKACRVPLGLFGRSGGEGGRRGLGGYFDPGF